MSHLKVITEISKRRALVGILMIVGAGVASFAIACGGTETVIVKETVIVEKEVEVERFVEVEVEKVVVQTVVVEREVQVAGETVVQTVVIEREVIREVEVEVPIEVVREVEVEIPVEVERVVEVEVVREVVVVATPTAIQIPTPLPSPTPSPTEIPTPTATPSPTPGPPSTPAELVERVQDSIVRVEARTGGFIFFQSTGSGFIFAAEGTTAFVATNHHVIEGKSSVEVQLKNSGTYDALVLGWDAERDVAVLSICCSSDFIALQWGETSPSEGESVIAIGYPDSDTEIVIATIGEVRAPDDLSMEHDFIPHSAPLNPGNSGGPLFSMPGAEVVGINTARSTEALAFYAVPFQAIAQQVADWRSQLIVAPTATPAYIIPLETARGQDFIYTLHEIRDHLEHREEWHEPKAGYRLVGFEMTLEALSDGADFDTWGIKVEDTEGYVHHYELGTFQLEPTLRVSKGELIVNQKVRGWITFEVPSSAVLSAILLPEDSGEIVVIGDQAAVAADLVQTPMPVPPAASTHFIAFAGVKVDGGIYTVHSILDPAPLAPNASSSRDPGKRFVTIDIGVEAIEDGVWPVYGEFKVQDSEGYVYDATRLSNVDVGPIFDSGKLPAGQRVRGWVTFEVPARASLYAVLVDPIGGSGKNVIADLTND